MTDPKKQEQANQNLLGAMTYLLFFVTGIVFLILEKQNKFIRFHAMQSTLTFGGLFILLIISGFIPYIDSLLRFVIWVVWVVAWIVLLSKSFSGQMYKLPKVGEIAERELSRI